MLKCEAKKLQNQRLPADYMILWCTNVPINSSPRGIEPLLSLVLFFRLSHVLHVLLQVVVSDVFEGVAQSVVLVKESVLLMVSLDDASGGSSHQDSIPSCTRTSRLDLAHLVPSDSFKHWRLWSWSGGILKVLLPYLQLWWRDGVVWCGGGGDVMMWLCGGLIWGGGAGWSGGVSWCSSVGWYVAWFDVMVWYCEEVVVAVWSQDETSRQAATSLNFCLSSLGLRPCGANLLVSS